MILTPDLNPGLIAGTKQRKGENMSEKNHIKDDDVIEPEEIIEIEAEPVDDKQKNNMKSTIAILLAILYILSPIDIIPEFLFGPVGLIDDAAVLAYLMKLIYDRFRS